jgi:flagellar biogenesis protein FliO
MAKAAQGLPLGMIGKTPRNWIVGGGIALAAIVTGLLLPQVLPALSAPAAETQTQTVPPASPSGTLSYTPPSWPEGPNHQAMLLRLVLGTAIVLGLCAGTLWICKRWLRGAPAQRPANSQVCLVETLPLGNRCCLHLVHVANRPVLIGADGSGIKTVVPLPDSFSTVLETQEEHPAEAAGGVRLTAYSTPQARGIMGG